MELIFIIIAALFLSTLILLCGDLALFLLKIKYDKQKEKEEKLKDDEKREICAYYCRWPEKVRDQRRLREKCSSCPLNRHKEEQNERFRRN